MSIISRRKFMQGAGLILGGGLVAPKTVMAARVADKRSIEFVNNHTGESFKGVFKHNGHYVGESIDEINRVLRDHRTGDVAEMDEQLIDLMWVLREKVRKDSPYKIISGYRSPKTNAMLRGKSSGVAKKSYHMQGKAVDLNLPGVSLSELRSMAVSMKAGGVGFYPKSGFLHVDTGRVRQW